MKNPKSWLHTSISERPLIVSQLSTKTTNHLFEFEDLDWFPGMIRRGMMDYLSLLFSFTNIYQPVTGLLSEALTSTKATAIVDLCSGGGGAIEQIHNDLRQQNNSDIQVTLTDKFPNLHAFEHLARQSEGSINYSRDSVDATLVSPKLVGFRTMFSAMHHFSKEMGSAILKNAVKAKSGVGIFDGGDKNIFFMLLMIVTHCIGFLVLTPFIRPFCLGRIFFTYIIPLIPLCTIWDGFVSITRLYNPAELMQMAKAADDKTYTWKAGKIKNRLGLNVAYLVGYPAK